MCLHYVNEQLEVSRQNVSNCLRLSQIGKAQKIGKWVQQTTSEWKRAKTHVTFCSLGTKTRTIRCKSFREQDKRPKFWKL